MNEVMLISDQIETTFRGKSWHGPNMIQIIEGISMEKARAYPISGRHSIWELVNHMNYWMRVALIEMSVEEKISRPMRVEDWPLVGVTAGDWDESVADLERTKNTILNALKNFPSTRLEEKVPGRDFNYRSLLHGVLHHNLYHMGQIAVFK